MSASAPAKKFTSFYRLAGLGYLDALNVAAVSLRKCLKEPARSEAMSRANYKYREFSFVDGHESTPIEVFSHPSLAVKK